MKYITPEYNNTIVEAKDVITGSTDKFEIQRDEKDEGKGNVIINASDIF